MDTLEHCMGDQKMVLFHCTICVRLLIAVFQQIMGETKGVILGRRQEESRMTKKMGSLELEILRGYNLTAESTFYQSRRFGDSTGSSGFNNTGASSGTSLMKSSGGRNTRNLASSAKTLPPLNRNGHNAKGMPRNNSSML
jgi:hypothetical protein